MTHIGTRVGLFERPEPPAVMADRVSAFLEADRAAALLDLAPLGYKPTFGAFFSVWKVADELVVDGVGNGFVVFGGGNVDGGAVRGFAAVDDVVVARVGGIRLSTQLGRHASCSMRGMLRVGWIVVRGCLDLVRKDGVVVEILSAVYGRLIGSDAWKVLE